MRLLLINPNTTQAMTDKVLAVARAGVSDEVELVGATGRFGAAYVASRAAYAIAGHAALDAWANAPGTFDAVVLACFGDPGLDALREICPVPVVGMADAALFVAAQLGARIGIVTGGERWGPMLREFVAARGLADRVASIRTVAPTGADIARDLPSARASMRKMDRRRCCASPSGALRKVGQAVFVSKQAFRQKKNPAQCAGFKRFAPLKSEMGGSRTS